MKKVKISEIVVFCETFGGALKDKKDIPFSLGIKLKKLINAVSLEYSEYDSKRKEIFSEIAGEGNDSIESDEDKKKFISKMNEILKTEVSVDLPTVTVEELDSAGFKCSMDDIFAIEPFIEV
jgi:hypothetical protein